MTDKDKSEHHGLPKDETPIPPTFAYDGGVDIAVPVPSMQRMMEEAIAPMITRVRDATKYSTEHEWADTVYTININVQDGTFVHTLDVGYGTSRVSVQSADFEEVVNEFERRVLYVNQAKKPVPLLTRE